MYDDSVRPFPRNMDEFWEGLEHHFAQVEGILHSTPVQTRDDAIENCSPTGNKISFRRTSPDFDSRDFYLTEGRKLLPLVCQLIEERAFTPEFVEAWGRIMTCSGFIAAYILDDSDAFPQHRAGFARGRLVSRDSQRRWLAHLFVQLIDDGLKRAAAEERIVHAIKDIIASETFEENFGKQWYIAMITHGDLASTYDEKHFSLKEMRSRINDSGVLIPAVPSLVP